MLIQLPPGRRSLLRVLQRNADTTCFPANVRLVISEPVSMKNITMYFKPALRKRTLFNVVGVLPGKTQPEEWILITAHYDHVGVLKKRRDSIFNGANDNASGTAAMMMLARYYAARRNNNRGIIFIGFAGEEIGLVGSRYFAHNSSRLNIKAVVNLEMLGKPHREGHRVCMVTGGGDLPSWFRNTAVDSGIKIGYDERPEQRLFRRSDNYPFFLKGIPAHTFMNWVDNDRDYHQPSDELSTLDLGNMCELVKGLIPGLDGLISGEFTPHVTGE
ncbi:MAG TPA: M28 family peptidase, partial [Chitinophagaceae bacterium]